MAVARREEGMMSKARSVRIGDIDQASRGFASPPCLMHEVDASYLGFWNEAEVRAFLLRLLDLERAAIGDVECAVGDPLSDLAIGIQIAHSLCCVLIRKQIARYGGASPRPAYRCDSSFQEQRSSEQLITGAYQHQATLAREVEQALLKIFDQDLHKVLTVVRRIHLGQRNRLVRILA